MRTAYRFLLSLGIFCVAISMQAQNLIPQANEKGKFGYVNEEGKKVISYKYTEAYPFEEGIAKVKKGNKYGFIDEDGKAVGKIKYTLILPFTGSYCRVAVGGSYKDGVLTGEKWGFLNKRGEEILKPEYDEIGEFENGITYVIKSKKYGLINDHMDFILEPKYVAVGLPDKFGYAWFASSGKINKNTGKLENAKYGVVNQNGKIVIEPQFRTLGYFYNWRYDNGMRADNSAMISDLYNKYSLQKPLSKLYNPENILSSFLSTAQTKDNADSLREAYQRMTIYTDSSYMYFGKNALKLGIVDVTSGDVVVSEKEFSDIYCPSDGIAMVKKKKRKKTLLGYYNIQSGFFNSYEDDVVLEPYQDGVAKIQNKSDKSVYFIDKSGKKITEDFLMAMRFENGLCIVQSRNNNFGVIDNTGKVVIPFEYDNANQYFREGLLGLSKSGKWGAVDRSGTEVIPFVYNQLNEFRYGWAGVLDEAGKWGMIDKNNQQVLVCEWDDLKLITQPEPNLIWGKKEGKWFCYNRKQKSLAFETGFEDAFNFEDGKAAVAQNGKYGMIDMKGNIIVPCQLDNPMRLKRATKYMQMLGKTSLNMADAYRLNIYEDSSVNSFKITDVIPNDKWDY